VCVSAGGGAGAYAAAGTEEQRTCAVSLSIHGQSAGGRTAQDYSQDIAGM